MAGLVRQGGQQVVTVTTVSAMLRNLAIDLLHLAGVKEMAEAEGLLLDGGVGSAKCAEPRAAAELR